MKTNRIIIYPKDVQRITGKSARYGRTLLNKIRESNEKTKRQFISINEFAQFTGLSVDEVTSYLKD
jgi:Fic family protein